MAWYGEKPLPAMIFYIHSSNISPPSTEGWPTLWPAKIVPVFGIPWPFVVLGLSLLCPLLLLFDKKKYQVVFWWYPSDWSFKFIRFDHLKTDWGRIYRWFLCLGPIEIRRWVPLGKENEDDSKNETP